MTQASEVTIRLLFVDEGVYHNEEIVVSTDLLSKYERLVDLLQEEPAVLKRLHVDLDRLCSAQIAD